VEVHAIIPPSPTARLSGEPAAVRFAKVVADVAGGLLRYADVPFALFGHSMGGVVAFEVARALRGRGGLEPVGLFVSAALAPCIDRRSRALGPVSDAELLRRLECWNGTPREVLRNPELMALCLPMIRADIETHDAYRFDPGVPLDYRVVAFGGLADRLVSRADVEPWADVTTAGFVLHMLPGDHFFISGGTFLPTFAAELDMLVPRVVSEPWPVAPRAC
jgi:surfactin synthase thioesterase subunit